MRVAFLRSLSLVNMVIFAAAALSGGFSFYFHNEGSSYWIHTAGLAAFTLAIGAYLIIFSANEKKKIAETCFQLFMREVPFHDGELMEGYRRLVNGALKTANDDLKTLVAARDAHVKPDNGAVYAPEAYDKYNAALMQLRSSIEDAETNLNEMRVGAKMLFRPKQLTHFAV